MKSKSKKIKYLIILTFISVFLPKLAYGQVRPDNTLPNPSIVNTNNNRYTITGGTLRGTTLFHSFQELSVPNNGVIDFQNSLQVQNILTRITGNNISNINGLIKTNGTANFFLINPNGIYFGPNARLDLGGSGVFSTANSIKFPDGSQYSATLKNPPPVSINIDRFLALGYDNPLPNASIIIKGNGHNLTDTSISPISNRTPSQGLQVKSGRTLGFFGGDIQLDGAIITAEGGRINLGAIKGSGNVTLTPNLSNNIWTASYDSGLQLGNINLSNLTLVDSSSPIPVTTPGEIFIRGSNIRLQDSSIILNQNKNSLLSGIIDLNASETIQIDRYSPGAALRTGVVSQALEKGGGANINISTGQLLIDDGNIVLLNRGSGITGNTNILAEKIKLSNYF